MPVHGRKYRPNIALPSKGFPSPRRGIHQLLLGSLPELPSLRYRYYSEHPCMHLSGSACRETAKHVRPWSAQLPRRTDDDFHSSSPPSKMCLFHGLGPWASRLFARFWTAGAESRQCFQALPEFPAQHPGVGVAFASASDIVNSFAAFIKGLPYLATCVLSLASLPAMPADLTTPVQQRIAIKGPNSECTDTASTRRLRPPLSSPLTR